MRAKRGMIGAAFGFGLLLAGCSDRDPQLMNLRSQTQGPDEFSILPTKPLQLPADYSALPPPLPGGVSRTDPTPEADAIAALGGNPAVLARGTGGDAAILAQASRFGVAGDIRSQLATEDLEWRRTHNGRLLEKVFNLTVYFRAYRPMALDQQAELARWRGVGIRTNSAPPDADAR